MDSEINRNSNSSTVEQSTNLSSETPLLQETGTVTHSVVGDIPDPPTVLLFVRPQKSDYVSCGRLEVASVDEIDGQLCVSWQLMDYVSIKESAYFQQVLKLQKGGSMVGTGSAVFE